MSARRRLDPLSSLLLGLAGGALFGARRDLSSRLRAAATVGGLALIGAAAHRPLSDALCRAGVRRRASDLNLSLVVPYPVETVFAFLRDFENWPLFVRGLRTVHDFDDGRSHWVARTPAGGTLEWDTVTTKYVPNSVIAWESVGSAPVRMSAMLRFLPEGANSCLQISVAYHVLDSSVADAIAALMKSSRAPRLQADFRHLAVALDASLARGAYGPAGEPPGQ